MSAVPQESVATTKCPLYRGFEVIFMGAGLGLEAPVDYIFYGDSRKITCLKKTLGKLDNSLNVKVEKWVKIE